MTISPAAQAVLDRLTPDARRRFNHLSRAQRARLLGGFDWGPDPIAQAELLDAIGEDKLPDPPPPRALLDVLEAPAPPAAAPARPKRTTFATRRLPADPAVAPKRFVDGYAAVPWDLIRDPKLGSGDKTVALGLAALTYESDTESNARNEEIGRACGGLSKSEVVLALAHLEEAGWITRALAKRGTRPGARRRIILRWRLDDDGRGTRLSSMPMPRSFMVARPDNRIPIAGQAALPLDEKGGVR